MTPEPILCRPEAYWLFAQQLPLVGTTNGLWRAVAAVSMHAMDDVDLLQVDERLEALAERVRSGAASGRPRAVFAHLHDVLFDRERFAGETQNYYSPLNSYLPVVLENRRGLPIILAVIYKAVAERVGLRVEGINSPGHFLARIFVDGKWIIVDPYFQGQVLTRDEALARLTDLTGQSLHGQDQYLQPATHHQWLSRILTNLQNIFASEGRQADLAAMNELQKLLWEST